jgi:uncharacterized membrane protein YhaH (DUF805 family)
MAKKEKKMVYKVKTSLDYHYHKINRNLYLVLWLFLAVLMISILVPFGLRSDIANPVPLWSLLGGYLGFISVLFLPFIIYYEVRTIQIRRIKDLVFSEVKLSNMVDDSIGNIMKIHFVVDLVYEGQPLQKETEDIFFTRSIFPNAVAADYLNQIVTVGYSPSHNELLVFPLPNVEA